MWLDSQGSQKYFDGAFYGVDDFIPKSEANSGLTEGGVLPLRLPHPLRPPTKVGCWLVSLTAGPSHSVSTQHAFLYHLEL